MSLLNDMRTQVRSRRVSMHSHVTSGGGSVPPQRHAEPPCEHALHTSLTRAPFPTTRAQGLAPDTVTLNGVIDAHARAGQLEQARGAATAV